MSNTPRRTTLHQTMNVQTGSKQDLRAMTPASTGRPSRLGQELMNSPEPSSPLESPRSNSRAATAKKPSTQATVARVGERSRRFAYLNRDDDDVVYGTGLPSIGEVIAARTKLDTTYGIKGYEIAKYDGKIHDKYNYETTVSNWNRDKGSFIDIETRSKEFVPSPDQYQNNEQPENRHIYKTTNAPALYMTSRKTDLAEHVDYQSKRIIGPGSFDPMKANRRVTGVYGGQPRVTMAECEIAGLEELPAPSHYNLPAFQVTKKQSMRTVIKAESDKEKELKLRKWAKTDKPNPFTYTTVECEKKLSTRRRQTSWSFVRGQR